MKKILSNFYISYMIFLILQGVGTYFLGWKFMLSFAVLIIAVAGALIIIDRAIRLYINRQMYKVGQSIESMMADAMTDKGIMLHQRGLWKELFRKHVKMVITDNTIDKIAKEFYIKKFNTEDVPTRPQA